ncbi:LacI family DNA-binding transcriptional regulator [Niabella ginsengisoli]|uniref:LacI family transcriptional regulator n=1 Tax=Niabella ginsengisoli TaxID=522298 RepID=A0ABS9SGT2_9BACT|nr:LacI family DNA-binding transcriptional regulator [Niabella ginsengisoli]MCH5597569.1 LacI family transcriptional regulator [Niabella ginsengisoli]
MSNEKGVTIVDIAHRLNMSASTVSKALKDDKTISAITRERVKALAKEWNYIPNQAARNFQQNKSFTLAIVIPDLLDQFYALAINGIEEVAIQNNYNVIICQSYDNSEREINILNHLVSSRIDGIIIVVSKNTKDLTIFDNMEKQGIPIVFFARSIQQPSFSSVSSDHNDGALKAINLLIKRGHKRIAHLAGPNALLTSHLRHTAYKKALEQNNIPYDAALVKATDFSYESTSTALTELYKDKHPPTAFFVFKSYVGLDIKRFLQSSHPKKLKHTDIIGFGNLPLIKQLETKPTASLDENSQMMGRQAAELLFEKIKDTEAEKFHLRKILLSLATLLYMNKQ